MAPARSRAVAIEAARLLLVEQGPHAVTLKAVAARIGRSHANLLHHFGSADGLYQALVAQMGQDIVATIREAVLKARAGERDPRDVVDLIFDAFDTGGAGAVGGWMILTGQRDALDPVLDAIHDLVDELAGSHVEAAPPIRDKTLHLVLLALGDALFGAGMARALSVPRGRARDLALAMLCGDR